MVESREYYIQEPVDIFDRLILNHIIASHNIRNRRGYELDALDEKLIYQTIIEMAANGELDWETYKNHLFK